MRYLNKFILLAKKDYIIPSLAIVCVIALILYGPISQDPNYHIFADQRSLLNIPNFLNVITNLPFVFVGLLGIKVVTKIKEKKLKNISFMVFTGFLLVTIGSSYYHLWPNNITLVYDRIPIVIIVMSFFAWVIYECISPRKGCKALIIFNIIGLISVIYWIITEQFGKGDLRWYGVVQFYPIVAIPIMLVLYKSTFKHWKEVGLIFLLFAIARLSEKFDAEIYNFLNEIISGHSIKHLFMAGAGYEIVVLLHDRLKTI